ncbi:hypothetical protein KDK95_34695, partial [Actinospica sp. MGRD01-02]
MAELDARRDEIVAECLRDAQDLHAGDREGADVLLQLAQMLGRREQAGHGQLIRALAQADRVKAARGGVKAWAATHLDVSDGRARSIAECARRIGAIPQLAEPLASGRIGADTVRVLSRTAKAVAGTGVDTAAALTATLVTAEAEGVTAAAKQIRALEHTLDPDTSKDVIARQRARSFYRVVELEDGLCRFEVLLDAVRATTLRSAIDAQTADWIRQAQYDHASPLPEDVRSTEQINAHALTRIAEVFLNAPAPVRTATFSPPMLFSVPAGSPNPLAETVYGTPVPVGAVPDPEPHLLELDEDGDPVRLDGTAIDTDPHARLASSAQRVALAFRDRHCTHAGCTRPPTFALHAHHTL